MDEHMCHGQGCRVLLGMVIPPFNRNPYNGYINPYYWVDEFIPYYMEIMNGSLDPGTYRSSTPPLSPSLLDRTFLWQPCVQKHLKALGPGVRGVC